MAAITEGGSLPIALDGARKLARQPDQGPHPLGHRRAGADLRRGRRPARPARASWCRTPPSRARRATSSPRRGPPILDRNGLELAVDIRVPSLFAEPRRIIDVDEAAQAIHSVLPDLNLDWLRGRLTGDKGFVWIKRELTPGDRGQDHAARHSRARFPHREQALLSGRHRSLAHPRRGQHRQPGHRRHRKGDGQRRRRAAAVARPGARQRAGAGATCRSTCASST